MAQKVHVNAGVEKRRGDTRLYCGPWPELTGKAPPPATLFVTSATEDWDAQEQLYLPYYNFLCG
jgi:hypothetical protein